MTRQGWVVLAVCLSACPPAMPHIEFFRASAEQVEGGQPVVLSWSASGVEGCVLEPKLGDVAPEGTLEVFPTDDTTYELTCGTDSRSTRVEVTGTPRIVSFAADRDTVSADFPLVLSWEARAVETCTLTPGVGRVEAEGSVAVRINTDTTFELSCRRGSSLLSARRSVAVTFQTSLPVPALTVVEGDGVLELVRHDWDGAVTVYVAREPGLTAANVESLLEGRVYRRVVGPFVLSGLDNGQTLYLRVAASSGPHEGKLSLEQAATPRAAAPREDPFLADQWHLSVIGAPEVWAQGVTGRGVNVAVVDEGLELGHEDLRQNVSTGKSIDYVSGTVFPGAHGTSVAGLAVARDLNGVGGRGVAPRARIRSFGVLLDLTSTNQLDAMRRDDDELGISVNTWGEPDNTGLLTVPDALWLQGVREGATQGRQGKGVVYFWASGNGADPLNGPIDDSNFDSQANSRYVLAVTTVGFDGTKPLYAEGGANVLIAAPSKGDDKKGLLTTDLTGEQGYNFGSLTGEVSNVNYTAQFDGTSGATPVAAGVGALLLEVRPDLSYRDVRRVLARTAQRVDAASLGWRVNGAGLWVHHDYGFGRVDARAAVALARTVALVGPEKRFSMEAAAGLMVVDQAEVRSTLQVSGSGIGHLEFVEVEVTLPHARSGDLELSLERAGGLRDLLHPSHACGERCSAIDHFVFTSAHHLDEPADGAWSLVVRDVMTGETGRLEGWTLRLYGRE